MRNPFDPFGILKEWKGQDPDEDEFSFLDSTVSEVYESESNQVDEFVTSLVRAGIEAERNRVIDIINQELSATDAKRLLELIEIDE